LTRLSFSKYQGAGNDFILIDDREKIFPLKRELIQKLCDRQYGIGADGLLLLQNSTRADFRMRIFNSDGGEAEMCGNGIRCLFQFIQKLDSKKKKLEIETASSLYSCWQEGSQIAVLLPTPKLILDSLPGVDFVNTGVPHALVFVPDIQKVDVANQGRELRFHPHFAKEGTNATFVQFFPKEKRINIRTYERGVEKETLACGTGAAAAGFAVIKKFSLDGAVKVVTLSKETLYVNVDKKGVELKGPAVQIFQGQIEIKSLKKE
jgi:diaminopimelate epimerase